MMNHDSMLFFYWLLKPLYHHSFKIWKLLTMSKLCWGFLKSFLKIHKDTILQALVLQRCWMFSFFEKRCWATSLFKKKKNLKQILISLSFIIYTIQLSWAFYTISINKWHLIHHLASSNIHLTFLKISSHKKPY